MGRIVVMMYVCGFGINVVQVDHMMDGRAWPYVTTISTRLWSVMPIHKPSRHVAED